MQYCLAGSNLPAYLIPIGADHGSQRQTHGTDHDSQRQTHGGTDHGAFVGSRAMMIRGNLGLRHHKPVVYCAGLIDSG